MFDLKIETIENKLCIVVENYVSPIPSGPDTFYHDVIAYLIDAGYEVNGYEREYLFIKDNDVIYDGTFVTNACFWNAIIELYETGKTTLGVIDADMTEEIINDWFR